MSKPLDEAVLYIGVGSWKQAARALDAALESCLREGETPAFAELARALPREILTEHPWLDYVAGMALANDYAANTFAHFEHVAQKFAAIGDARGELLASAARVESQIRSRATHAGLAPWIARLQGLHEQYRYDGDAVGELRVCASLLAGCLYFAPSAAIVNVLGERTLALARVTDVADDALMAATYLLAFAELKQREDTFCQVNALARQWTASQHASAIRVGEWFSERALHEATRARFSRAFDEQSRDLLQQASQWVAQHDLKPLKFKIERIHFDFLNLADNRHEAVRVLRNAETLIAPTHLLDWVTYFFKRAELSVALQQADDALRYSDNLLHLCDEAGVSETRRVIFSTMRASALVMLGRYDAAADAFDILAERSASEHRAHFAAPADCLRALLLWDDDRCRALAYIARTMAALRSIQSMRIFWAAPTVVAIFIDRALAAHIEPEFARAIIASRNLVPPKNASAQWPWRLKIRVMGKLRIERDDETIAVEGKAQRRPLDILAALVIAGREEVAVDALLHRVFPSTEHDDPKGSFEVALFRLRKLLGVDGAIRLKGGRLSLDPSLVWNDLAHIDTVIDAHARAENDEQAITLGCDLIDTYKGVLFGDDCPHFALARREQLRRKVESVVEKTATLYEQRRDFARALGIWEIGLAHEPIHESFYRGLMRCHAATGDAAAALALYRRCAEILSKVLAIAPSKDTEALRAEIQQRAA